MNVFLLIFFIVILVILVWIHTQNDDLEIINKDGYVDGTKEDSVNQGLKETIGKTSQYLF